MGRRKKSIDIYVEKVMEWVKRVNPYLCPGQVIREEPNGRFARLLFISETYYQLYVDQIRNEVRTIYSKERVIWIYISGGSSKKWTPKARQQIEDWFAEHYPGVNPWQKKKPSTTTQRA